MVQGPVLQRSLAKKLTSVCLCPENLNQGEIKPYQAGLFCGMAVLLISLGQVSSESEQEVKPNM